MVRMQLSLVYTSQVVNLMRRLRFVLICLQRLARRAGEASGAQVTHYISPSRRVNGRAAQGRDESGGALTQRRAYSIDLRMLQSGDLLMTSSFGTAVESC